ncbi:MAG: hypothetical protein ACO1Q7_15055 [Gemmatimonas sp.]
MSSNFLSSITASLAGPHVRSALILAAIGLTACSDREIPTQVAKEEPAPAIPAPPVPPPAPAVTVMLDASLLRDVGLRRFSAGDQYSLAFDSTGSAPVANTVVQLTDTSIIAIDTAGVLHAKRNGNVWLTWPRAESTDSALVTVSDPVTNTESYTVPTAPQRTVDMRYPAASRGRVGAGKQWRVEAGQDLQAALNSAQPGDEVVLAQGATFTGNYTLPLKAGASTEWVVLRAEVVPVAAGTRITPTLATNVAKIVTPNQNPAIKTAPGARRWRLVGFEIGHKQGAIYNYGIVVLGAGNESSVNDMPSEIILDRMYVHGSTTDGTSRCVAFNGRSLAVVSSWLDECHAKGQDAQGVCGWGGPGPFLIENNYIAASGQAIMFGGADPVVTNVSPSDITIRRNHFFKPMSWARGRWTVKATFELKHARRVLFEQNVLENHWADAQEGYAMLFQAVSQYERAPWTTIEDVMVRNNIIRNSTSGAVLLARYSNLIITPTSRVSFVNNMWENVGIDPVSNAKGTFFLLLGALRDVTLANNSVTLDSARQAARGIYFDGFGGTRTTIMNNLLAKSTYGVAGSGIGSGTIALAAYAIGSVFSGNVVPSVQASTYPVNNFFPSGDPLLTRSSSNYTESCGQVQTWLSTLQFGVQVGAVCGDLEQTRLAVVADGITP